MYYIKYNEIDLTDMVKVREVEIPSLPSIEHSSIDIFERDGGVYNGASYGTREIKLTFIIKPDNRDDYEQYVQDVKRAFYTKEECRLFCGDENLYIWCVPVDDMVITELGEGCAEGEVNLVSYDPYWYSVDQQAVNNNDKKKFTVENESDTNVYPVIQVGFTRDTTFLQIRNRSTNETILIVLFSFSGTTTINNVSLVSLFLMCKNVVSLVNPTFIIGYAGTSLSLVTVNLLASLLLTAFCFVLYQYGSYDTKLTSHSAQAVPNSVIIKSSTGTHHI